MGIAQLHTGSSQDGLQFRVWFKEKNGKKRPVAEPSPGLYLLHKKIIGYLESLSVPLPSATGMVKGGSPIKNVLLHREGQYFYLLDIKKAYQSMTAKRLAGVLHNLEEFRTDYDEIVEFLERYCFVPGEGLATGAPASPLFFNIYFEIEVDQKIRKLLAKHGEVPGRPCFRYTRYVDDLTISSSTTRVSRSIRKEIRSVISEAGFDIHPEKSRLLTRGKDAIEINGLRLLPEGRLSLSQEFLNSLEKRLDVWLVSRDETETKHLRGLIGHFTGLVRELDHNRLSRRVRKKVEMVLSLLKSGKEARQPWFSSEWLKELRSKAPFKEIVEESVKLKWHKGGTEGIGLSPFRNEKTPSFTLSLRKGFYHCFSSGEHGDVISFVMLRNNCSFVQAVKQIAERVDMPLPPRPGKP